MKKILTLKKSNDFQRILQKGKWYGGNLISTYIIPNNLNENYIGIAVSKKAGNAVKRNKIKRIIREVYRNIPNLKKGYSVVFVWKAKRAFEELNFCTINKDMIKCFTKAKLLTEPNNICEEES